MPCRTASVGSAAAASTTSAADCPSRRRRPTASRRSTTCSSSNRVLRARCMRASTSRAQSPAVRSTVNPARASGCASTHRPLSSWRRASRRAPPPVHDGEWDAAWSVPQRGDSALVLLARAGAVDPGSLASYEAHGGYDALRKAMEIGASAVVDEVVRSGLVGRGGAAFPPDGSGKRSRGTRRRPTTSSPMPTKVSPAPSRTGC